MTSPLADAASPCGRCGAALAADARACEGCQALVHQAQLESLSARARVAEQARDPATACDLWQQALALLPPQSTQADWIRHRAAQLEGLVQRSVAARRRDAWARRFGPLAPVLLFLAKGKFLLTLLKLRFLLSFAAFAGLYWALYGFKFGVGVAVLVLVHEFGHFLELRRRGLPASLPVFVPGLGAYVRWQASGTTLSTRAWVSLAGPLAGTLAAAACAALWALEGSRLWLGLAGFSALLNLFNLIPVGFLDGGQAMAALDKGERIALCVIAVLCAIVYSQPLFILVAAGAGYRLFTRDLPDRSGRWVMAYYVVLLVALGYLVQLAPMGPASRPPAASHTSAGDAR